MPQDQKPSLDVSASADVAEYDDVIKAPSPIRDVCALGLSEHLRYRGEQAVGLGNLQQFGPLCQAGHGGSEQLTSCLTPARRLIQVCKYNSNRLMDDCVACGNARTPDHQVRR
jgi:hypothetical protein